MNTALALIKKCLANKEPVLNLGNCGLIDEDLSIGSEVGQRPPSYFFYLCDKRLVIVNTHE